MKVIGWIFLVIGLIALGYCACEFGWIESLIGLIKSIQ